MYVYTVYIMLSCTYNAHLHQGTFSGDRDRERERKDIEVFHEYITIY